MMFADGACGATQKSPATSISPKGGGGTASISLSLLLHDVLTSRRRRFANSTPSRLPQTSPYLWNETLSERGSQEMNPLNSSVSIHSGRVSRPFLYSYLKFRWLQHPISPLELGRWGEWIGLKHLRKLGWDIVARNWKSFQGEVDLMPMMVPFWYSLR